jgi:hypothetical protein
VKVRIRLEILNYFTERAVHTECGLKRFDGLRFRSNSKTPNLTETEIRR